MIKFDRNDAILANIARIIEKRLKDEDSILEIVLDESLGEHEGRLEGGVILGGSYTEILYAAGRILRDPTICDQSFRSHKKICGLYWATHNMGYSEAAPLDELFEDMEDQALWGMNTLMFWIDLAQHKINESGAYIERLLALMKHAKSLGIRLAMNTIVNEAPDDSPEALRADWTSGHDGYTRALGAHYHREICPSKTGGLEKILEYRREMLEAFKDADLDYICIFPYDQGGCTCPDCAPWGGNGYVKCAESLIPLYKEYFPNISIILSTWYFGHFRLGDTSEFHLLAEAIANGRLKDADYILNEPQFGAYSFEHPLGRPMISFPEISMNGIFPWGGYGTTPLPRKIQKLWDTYGGALEGGFPYCEGFYEDINKVITLRQFRDNQPADATVREYLAYEFGFEGEMLDEMQAAVMDMEETHARDWEPGHRYPILKPQRIFDIEAAVIRAHESLDEEMKNSKKWRLIYYRALIDAELARNDFYRNDVVLGYFKEMIELYHLQGANWFVRPDDMVVERYGRPLTKAELKIIAFGGTIEE